MTQLTEQFHGSVDHYAARNRLTTLVQHHTQQLLEDEYWTDAYLDAIQDHTGQSYTYIGDADIDAFEDIDEYLGVSQIA